MTIRAVVFDIGGVLEITPQTGWVEKWEARLHLKPGKLDERLMDVWRAGSLGNISEEEVEKLRYPSSGDENALEEEDFGSIDSSSRAGS